MKKETLNVHTVNIHNTFGQNVDMSKTRVFLKIHTHPDVEVFVQTIPDRTIDPASGKLYTIETEIQWDDTE